MNFEISCFLHKERKVPQTRPVNPPGGGASSLTIDKTIENDGITLAFSLVLLRAELHLSSN